MNIFGSLSSLPIRRIVPEIVVSSLKEHPVKIVEGVLVAANISQVAGVVGRILVEVHCPGSTAGEISISRTSHVAVAAISFCSRCLVHAHTTPPILKPCIGKPCGIAGNDASKIK